MVRSLRPQIRILVTGRTTGFSIVELITVLILLSILSVVGISRSVTPSSFEAAIVSQFLVAEFRLARRMAMNRQDVNVVLIVSRSTDEVIVDVQTPTAVPLRNRRVARGRVELQADSQTLGLGEQFIIALDGRGRVNTVTLAGVPSLAASGLEISVMGDRTLALCVFPSGYTVDDSCA